MPFTTTLLDGGLVLNNPPVLSQPGTLVGCENFEVAYVNGYKRVDGDERFDGGESPSDQVPDATTAGDFFAARDAAYLAMRANVQEVPGTGPVVGLFWLRDSLYAARDTVALAVTGADATLVAGDVVADTATFSGDPNPFYGTVLRVDSAPAGSQIILYNTRGTPPIADQLYRGSSVVATVTGAATSPGAALYKAVGTRGGFGAGSWEHQNLGYVLNFTDGTVAFPNRTPGTVVVADIQTTVWKVPELMVDVGSYWSGTGGGGISNGSIPVAIQTDDGDTSYAAKAAGVVTSTTDRAARVSTWGFTEDEVPDGAIVTGLELEITRRAYYSDPAAASEYWVDSALQFSYPDATPTPGQPGPNFADTGTHWPQSGITPDNANYTTATYGAKQNNLGYGTLTPARLRDDDFTLWFNAQYSLGPLVAPDGSQAQITLIKLRAHYSPPSPRLYIWNGTSAVFVDIVRAYTQSGDITTMDAAGVLYITATGVTRPIASGEEIRTLPGAGVTPDGGAADGSSLVAKTSSGMTDNLLDGSAAIAATASKYQSISTNFTSAEDFEGIYGVSGAGPAFAYDGTAFTRILTGAPAELEKPRHIVRHKDRLWLGYKSGDVTFSAPNEPLNFDATDTAGTKNFGAPIHGFAVQNGETLGVYTRDDVQMIQGPILTFASATISPNVGCFEYSVITTGNYVYLSNRGIQGVGQTPAYGDFDSATLSQAVWPWLADRVQQPINTPEKKTSRKFTNAVAARAKHQCRYYFDDGAILTATFLRAGEVPQFTFQQHDNVWQVLISVVESTGRDRVFGSYGVTGFVYELDKGNRFDAAVITGYVELTPDDLKSPFTTKQFSDARVHGQTYGWADFKLSRAANYDAPNPAINYPCRFGESTSTAFSDPRNFVSRPPVRKAEGFAIALRFDVSTGSQSPVTVQAVEIFTIQQGEQRT